MGFLGFLGTPLGYVMQFIYNYIVQDYGLALVLFTVLLRVVMFPLAIKQQKSSARQAAYQPMITEIQKKYAADQKRQQEEMAKLQEEYGYSPMAGCLPTLINMLVLFGIIEVVYSPLTHILHIPSDIISAAATAGNITNNFAGQSKIISAVISGDSAVMTALGDYLKPVQSFNVTWGNLNLMAMPSVSSILTLVFPILSIVTMVLSTLIMQKTSGQKLEGSMKYMPWIFSAIFVYFGFTVPVGFSLYYTVSNVLTVIQSLIVAKIYDPEVMKKQVADEIEAKKKAKKEKKKISVKTETGETVKKEVTDSEMASIRLQRAREIDAQRYADERTVPLSELNSKTGEAEGSPVPGSAEQPEAQPEAPASEEPSDEQTGEDTKQ